MNVCCATLPQALTYGLFFKRGLIVTPSDGGALRKVFYMVWQDADLKLLRDLAAEKCPEALSDIDNGVRLGRHRQESH